MTEYTLTKAQLQRLLDASKPIPYLVANGVEPVSPHERVIQVWKELGEEMGFDWRTAGPAGSDRHKFIAAPKKQGEP